MYDAVGIEMRRLLGYRGVIPSGWAGLGERGQPSSRVSIPLGWTGQGDQGQRSSNAPSFRMGATGQSSPCQ